MCEPQLRTPGISRRSLQAATEMRVSSGAEVPGWVSQCMRKSRSLKFGSSWLPSVGAGQRAGQRARASAVAIAGPAGAAAGAARRGSRA